MRAFKTLSVLCIYLFLQTSFSQMKLENNYLSLSLSELLHYFEETEHITFSYDPEMIQDKELIFDMAIRTIKNISLNNFLSAFKEQTIFNVKQKDTDYIIYASNKPTTIKGKIIDLYTRKPIKNISISDMSNTVYSDHLGNFTMDTKPLSTLVLSDPIHRDKVLEVIDLINDPNFMIEMAEKSEYLDEVILTNEYLTFGIDKKKDGAIIISPKDMKLLPGLIEPNIMRSVALLPGCNSSSEGVRDISFRGSTSDHNLLLWDGIKIYNAGHLFDNLPMFNPHIIDNAKISRSGTSAKYGGRVAGVIDINSISEIPDKIEGGAGVSLTIADANLRVPLSKKLGIVVAGRHAVNNLISSSKLSNSIDNSLNTKGLNKNISLYNAINNDFSFYDFNTKLIWDPSSVHQIVISTIGSENKFMSQQSLSTTEEVRRETINFKNIGTSFSWKGKMGKNFSTILQSQYSKYQFNSNSNFNIIENKRFDGTSRFNTIIDFSTLYGVEVFLGGFSNLIGGYEYTHNKYAVNYQDIFEDTKILNYKEKLGTHSFFSEYTMDRKEYGLTAGIRTNYYKHLNIRVLEPRILARVQFLRNFSFTTSFERKSQAIRQDQQDPNTSSRSFIESNHVWLGPTNYLRNEEDGFNLFEENIPLLSTNQATVGISFKKRGWDIDVETYYKKNKGIISINTIETNDFTISEGTGETYGVDVLIKKKHKNYKTWLGYSYIDKTINFPTIQSQNFPSSYSYRHILNWSHTLDIKNFELGASWNYKSGTPYSIPSRYNQALGGESVRFEDFNIQYDNFNNYRLPSYHRINASLVYNFNWNKKKKWNTKVGVSVQNILNKRNIVGRGFSLSPRNPMTTIEVPINNSSNSIAQTKTLYQNDNVGLPFTMDLSIRMRF